jgi:hypothetical protein
LKRRGVLCCKKCKTKTNYYGVFKRNFVDMGGGYGRAKLIGNCPMCSYPYAVLFHAYCLEEEGVDVYFEYYLNSRLPDIINYIESKTS